MTFISANALARAFAVKAPAANFDDCYISGRTRQRRFRAFAFARLKSIGRAICVAHWVGGTQRIRRLIPALLFLAMASCIALPRPRCIGTITLVSKAGLDNAEKSPDYYQRQQLSGAPRRTFAGRGSEQRHRYASRLPRGPLRHVLRAAGIRRSAWRRRLGAGRRSCLSVPDRRRCSDRDAASRRVFAPSKAC